MGGLGKEGEGGERGEAARLRLAPPNSGNRRLLRSAYASRTKRGFNCGSRGCRGGRGEGEAAPEGLWKKAPKGAEEAPAPVDGGDGAAAEEGFDYQAAGAVGGHGEGIVGGRAGEEGGQYPSGAYVGDRQGEAEGGGALAHGLEIVLLVGLGG